MVLIIVGGWGAMHSMIFFSQDTLRTARDVLDDTCQKREIDIGGTRVRVWVADTPEKRERGLMFVESLHDEEGMMFVFEEAAPRTFWNQHTLIDLDMVWVRNGTVIGVSALSHIEGATPTLVSSPGEADMVFELPRGWAEHHGVTIGAGIHML